MKTLFTFKDQSFGYQLINGKIHNIHISNKLPIELIDIINSAEYEDISEEDKKALFDEKMHLSHTEG